MPEILKSPRFIAVLIIGALQALVLFNIISGEQGEGLVLIVQSILAVAVAVKTVDRVGDKAVIAAGVSSNQLPVSSVAVVPPSVD